MQITLELPENLAYLFGNSAEGLNKATVEALTVEALRSGKLTVAQSRHLLGISSWYEMDGFLKAKGLFIDLSPEDVERDAETALLFRTE